MNAVRQALLTLATSAMHACLKSPAVREKLTAALREEKEYAQALIALRDDINALLPEVESAPATPPAIPSTKDS